VLTPAQLSQRQAAARSSVLKRQQRGGLTEKELAQRRAAAPGASKAASERRQTQGLTRAELAQRRQIAWDRGAKNRKIAKGKQIAERLNLFEKAQTSPVKIEATAKQKASLRQHLIKVWHVPASLMDDNTTRDGEPLVLQSTGGMANKAVRNLALKASHLWRKGYSLPEIYEELDHRVIKMERKFGVNPNSHSLLNIVYESYPSGRKISHRRKPLSPRQRELKRQADARYRHYKRLRNAA
jgi:hypothetical protein